MQNPIHGGTPKSIFAELHACKILDDSAERALFKLYRETKNQAYRSNIKLRIIQSHLRFVFRMACDYASVYQLPVSDFYSAGKLGLISAIDEYDPEQKTKFGSYSVWAIRWQMQQFIDQSDPIHLPPKVRQRVLGALKRGKPASSVMFGEYAENVLHHTGSTSDKISDDGNLTVEDIIADKTDADIDPTFLDPAIRTILSETMQETLNQQEMSVLCASFGFNGYDMTNKDIAACTGVSKAHIRKIKLAALSKLSKNSKLQELFEECTGIVKT